MILWSVVALNRQPYLFVTGLGTATQPAALDVLCCQNQSLCHSFYRWLFADDTTYVWEIPHPPPPYSDSSFSRRIASLHRRYVISRSKRTLWSWNRIGLRRLKQSELLQLITAAIRHDQRSAFYSAIILVGLVRTRVTCTVCDRISVHVFYLVRQQNLISWRHHTIAFF